MAIAHQLYKTDNQKPRISVLGLLGIFLKYGLSDNLNSVLKCCQLIFGVDMSKELLIQRLFDEDKLQFVMDGFYANYDNDVVAINLNGVGGYVNTIAQLAPLYTDLNLYTFVPAFYESFSYKIDKEGVVTFVSKRSKSPFEVVWLQENDPEKTIVEYMKAERIYKRLVLSLIGLSEDVNIRSTDLLVGLDMFDMISRVEKMVNKTVWSAVRYDVNKAIEEGRVPDNATFCAFRLSPQDHRVVECRTFMQRHEYEQQEVRAKDGTSDFDGFIRIIDGTAFVPTKGIGMKMLLK